MLNFPTEQLKEWFRKNKRQLPWREDPTPYRIWISEIMLQQTQVSVVIPYFERWMRTFPTIFALARAPLDRILKCWEGLGYYSRARNAHKAAQYITHHFGGELPESATLLTQIPGIGSYTQGAIRGFAFRQKAAAVDGNVLRVLSRFLAFEKEIDLAPSKAEIERYAQKILPDVEPWLVSEGLIELGALVCTKKAHCGACPLQRECLAFRHNLHNVLPKKKERPKTIQLTRVVAIISCREKYLVQRRESGKVMADLYEFPYLENMESNADIVTLFERDLGLELSYLHAMKTQTHTFTRYRAHLLPHRMKAKGWGSGHLWKSKEELKNLPFSSGHKKIHKDENFTL